MPSSRLRLRLLRGALTCAVAFAAATASAGTSDRVAVTRTLDGFLEALVARDADAALRRISARSYPKWGMLRGLALHAPRAKLDALPTGDRLAVFAMRHYDPPFLRPEEPPRTQLVAALRDGLVDREAIALLDSGDVLVRGEQASARLYVSGLPSPLRAGFVREGADWKLDLDATLEAAGRFVARSAAEAGASEDSVIAGLLLMASSARPTTKIYEPLEPAAPAAAAP